VIKKHSYSLFIIVLILLFPFSLILSWPDNRLHFIVCDVGQGDSILVTKGFNQALIDGGPDKKVLDCLGKYLPFWDRNIELMVNTHPDADHLNGLIYVIERYKVDKLVVNGELSDSKNFYKFNQLITRKNIPLILPQAGDIITLGNVRFITLWPEENKNSHEYKSFSQDQRILEENFAINSNDKSLVLELRYGQINALLTGDISNKVEHIISSGYSFEDVEILKIAHHGSNGSSCDEFLDRVDPDMGIISSGDNNWGFPDDEVISRLRKRNIRILRTDIDGNISLVY
jgi:competence protein ComEC